MIERRKEGREEAKERERVRGGGRRDRWGEREGVRREKEGGRGKALDGEEKERKRRERKGMEATGGKKESQLEGKGGTGGEGSVKERRKNDGR